MTVKELIAKLEELGTEHDAHSLDVMLDDGLGDLADINDVEWDDAEKVFVIS